jgi:hypothetical protein
MLAQVISASQLHLKILNTRETRPISRPSVEVHSYEYDDTSYHTIVCRPRETMSTFLRAFAIFAITVEVALAAPATSGTSKTGRCGASFGAFTCKGSSYGDCCSSYGYCGSSRAYCGEGCQSGYGTCSASTSTPPSTSKVSTDGQCGTVRGSTCLGSKFGSCCS